MSTGYLPLFDAIEYCILGKNEDSNDIDSLSVKEVICYGALGREAKQLLPILMKTKIKPDLLWDEAALPNSNVLGKTVKKPDFLSLKKNDLFIIIPKSPVISMDLREQLKKRCIFVINNYDVLNYLGRKYYPFFYENDCIFNF